MGRFLRQAIDSICEQTDPNIECIIIDDVSTDESAVILLDISKRYPSAAIFRRNDNGGQTLAAQEGFNAVRANMWSSSTRTVFSCPNSMKRIFSFTCRCVFRGFTRPMSFKPSNHGSFFWDIFYFERICALGARQKIGPAATD